jgi:hypothetical protein
MGVRFTTQYTNTVQNPLPATNVETVIFATGPMLLAVDSAVVFLLWMVTITTGTGTTALVLRIRRGGTTSGFLIGTNPWTQKVTAGNSYTLSGCYFDQPGPVLQGYNLSVAQSNVSAAGTVVDGSLLAYVL